MLFQPETVRDFAPSDLVGNNAAILADILDRQFRGSVSIDAAGIAIAGGATDTLSVSVEFEGGTETAVFTFKNGGGFSRTAAFAADLDISGGLGADRGKVILAIIYGLSLLAGDFSEPVVGAGKAPFTTLPSGILNATPTPAADVVVGGGSGLAVWADAPVTFEIGAGLSGVSIDA